MTTTEEYRERFDADGYKYSEPNMGHSCLYFSIVIKCDNKTDLRKCHGCGTEFEKPCNYNDEDDHKV